MSNPSPPVPLSLIAAVARNGTIGVHGELPWRLSADLRRFKCLTMGHAIIMGRKTYESIGRLLPGRRTVVITRQPDWELAGATVCADLAGALAAVHDDNEPFVIGGGMVYQTALPLAQRLYLTQVEADVQGDVFFPQVDWRQWRLIQSECFPADESNQFPHRFEIYQRVA